MLKFRLSIFTTHLSLVLALPLLAQPGFKFFNPAMSDSIPKLISGTGMYKNMVTKEINADVIPFEVNAPLWTDGAIKARFIAVPAGKSVIYDDTADAYAYPDRAMVIKNFSIDTIPGNPASRILWETRFSGVRIVGGKEKWYLWAYRWKLDQTDADLVSDTGEFATVRVYKNGLDKAPFMKKWRYPGRLQCAACHRVAGTGGRNVLAFFTAQLNKPLSTDHNVNQLTHLFDIGILKTADESRPDFTKSPKWANWADTTASLELRARSYIAANCSGCHGDRGIETNAAYGITLNYDYHTLVPKMDFVTKELQGSFPASLSGLIVPGHPEKSVLLYRQKMRNQKDLDFTSEQMAMPPLGSYEPDTNAINMISAWITSLAPGAIKHGLNPNQNEKQIRLHGNVIEISGSIAGMSVQELDHANLTLVNLKGERVKLIRLQKGMYKISGAASAGVHYLFLNNRVIARVAI